MNDKIIEIFNALDEKMKKLNMPSTIVDNTTTADVSSGWNGAAGDDSADKTRITINEKNKKLNFKWKKEQLFLWWILQNKRNKSLIRMWI